MQIVIINGTPGSGKDQFVKEVQSLIGDYRCYNYSTVDFVKFVALCAGWKEDKTPRNRKFLSDLKNYLLIGMMFHIKRQEERSKMRTDMPMRMAVLMKA